ncbi:MAG: F-box protein [Candidatus Babeliales bacterium]
MSINLSIIFLLALASHNLEINKEINNTKGQTNSTINYNFVNEYFYDATQSPSLTNLPIEIFEKIVEEFEIKDFYSLMLVCQILKDLGQSCNPIFNIHDYKCYFDQLNHKKELTSKILIKLLKRFPNLIEINLGDMSLFFKHYTNDRVLEAIKNCHNLRILDLKNCRKVTDNGLYHISQGCNLLQKINLYGCKKISDQSLFFLSQGCRNLQDIEFCFSENLTAVGLHCLIQNCRDLNKIKLWNCDSVFDSDLDFLGQMCPSLQEIDLFKSETITDNGLINLFRLCQDLRRVKLFGFKKITDQTIIFLIENCSKLEYLDIRECDLITEESLRIIKMKLPAQWPHMLTIFAANSDKLLQR